MSGPLPEPELNDLLSYKQARIQNVAKTAGKPVNIVGCGFLGRKLLQQLLSRSLAEAKNITTLVKSESSRKHCLELGVQSVALDMDNDICSLPEAFKSGQSVLYYFMPPPGQGTEDSRSRHFIKLLETNASEQPARVVLISTTGVYGNCHGQWVDETTPLNPGVDRARRRVDAEQHFQSYCEKFNIPLVILRVSGIYGPGKLPLQRIRAQTPIVRAEDSPYSNRIHCDDLLEICLQAGFSKTIEGIFNCADGHPTTMYDYFIRVAQTHHLPAPPAISLEQAKTQLSSGMLSYMEESRRIDNRKLLTVFNMTLKYPDLDRGLSQNMSQ